MHSDKYLIVKIKLKDKMEVDNFLTLAEVWEIDIPNRTDRQSHTIFHWNIPIDTYPIF